MQDVGHSLGRDRARPDLRRNRPSRTRRSPGSSPRPRRGSRPLRSRHSSGEAIVGRSLSVSAVRLDPAAPPATYRWLRCNENGRRLLDDRRRAERQLRHHGGRHRPRADRGRVRPGLSVLSASSSVVRAARGRPRLARPAIDGTLRVGERLTGNAGVWSGGGTDLVRVPVVPLRTHAARSAARSAARPAAPTRSRAADTGAHARSHRARDGLDGTTAAYSSLAGLVAPASAALARPRPALVRRRRCRRAGTADRRRATPRSRHPSRTPGCGAPRQSEFAHRSRGADKTSYTVTKDDELRPPSSPPSAAVAAGERPGDAQDGGDWSGRAREPGSSSSSGTASRASPCSVLVSPERLTVSVSASPGLCAAMIARSCSARRHRRAVDGGDHVAGLDARRCRRRCRSRP